MRLSAGNYFLLLFIVLVTDFMLPLISFPHYVSSKLRDDCLSATTASCPLIESLVLMSCLSIGSDGLSSLNGLPNLTVLDLSYTFLMNLEPVFKSCFQLKVIKALWFVWCWMFSLSVSSTAYIISLSVTTSWVMLCAFFVYQSFMFYSYHILLLFGLALRLLSFRYSNYKPANISLTHHWSLYTKKVLYQHLRSWTCLMELSVRLR